MIRLRVFDVSSSGRRVAFWETAGVFHVAATPDDCGECMQVGDFMDSEHATLGPALLRHDEARPGLTVQFEAVGCSLRQAVRRLQE
jgi:hypothetical protein